MRRAAPGNADKQEKEGGGGCFFWCGEPGGGTKHLGWSVCESDKGREVFVRRRQQHLHRRDRKRAGAEQRAQEGYLTKEIQTREENKDIILYFYYNLYILMRK